MIEKINMLLWRGLFGSRVRGFAIAHPMLIELMFAVEAETCLQARIIPNWKLTHCNSIVISRSFIKPPSSLRHEKFRTEMCKIDI